MITFNKKIFQTKKREMPLSLSVLSLMLFKKLNKNNSTNLKITLIMKMLNKIMKNNPRTTNQMNPLSNKFKLLLNVLYMINLNHLLKLTKNPFIKLNISLILMLILMMMIHLLVNLLHHHHLKFNTLMVIIKVFI